MDVRTRQVIEAALDPKGKWYGAPWPEQPAPRAPNIEPARQEERFDGDPDVGTDQQTPGPNKPSWDEWEPA